MSYSSISRISKLLAVRTILNFVKSRRSVYKGKDKQALLRQKRCKKKKLDAALAKLITKLDDKKQLRASLQCTERV